MLHHTFCHIPGIGLKTEKELWDMRIFSWEDVMAAPLIDHPKISLDFMKSSVQESLKNLEENNIAYFSKLLSLHQYWRIFPHFRQKTAYLDIETTGLSTANEITTIALYDGKTIQTFVNGQNLENFPKALNSYEVLITYNGKNFDLPFIEKFFNIQLHQAHIDLRYILAGLGIKGGLKGSEKHFGLSRNELEGVDGFFAVLLWEEYKRNKNAKALETLLRYNIEDTVNLETLMIFAYNLKLKETPFEAQAIELPVQPLIYFHPDTQTIEKVRLIYDRYKRKT